MIETTIFHFQPILAVCQILWWFPRFPLHHIFGRVHSEHPYPRCHQPRKEKHYFITATIEGVSAKPC